MVMENYSSCGLSNLLTSVYDTTCSKHWGGLLEDVSPLSRQRRFYSQIQIRYVYHRGLMCLAFLFWDLTELLIKRCRIHRDPMGIAIENSAVEIAEKLWGQPGIPFREGWEVKVYSGLSTRKRRAGYSRGTSFLLSFVRCQFCFHFHFVSRKFRL